MATQDKPTVRDESLEETSPDLPSGEVEVDATTNDLVLGLARRITRLAEDDEDVEVEDPNIAHRLAMSVKPYVDRLVALRHLLKPVGRIIEKRGQIEGLRDELAEDIATVEGASQDLGDVVDVNLVTELHNELEAVKRERKLFADEDEDEEDDNLPEPADLDAEEKPPRQARRSFLERPVTERLRLVLGPRFIDLDSLDRIFGGALPGNESELAAQRLERVWDGLMQIEAFGHHAREEQLTPLRKALRDYVLVYRTPRLPDGEGELPCSICHLKDQIPARFVQASERSLWYSGLPFYRDTFAEGHWALLDKQYLNCTFKQPKIRLGMYARANGLPPQAMQQKSVLEDVYDRAVVDAAMETVFFDNCNSLTRTSYQQKDEPAKKVVHVYYRDGQIRISGKRGVPHWRPGKPRWPGVFPAIVFDQPIKD